MATGYYYYRVTGSPFRMTYQVNRGRYSQAPYFLWQEPRPEPVYHHPVMRDFYQREFRVFQESQTLPGFLHESVGKIWSSWDFYLGPVFTHSPAAATLDISRPAHAIPIACVRSLLLVGIMVETWTSPHYLAAATGLLYLVLMQCMRHLRLWRWHGQGYGAAIVRAIPVICCALIVLRLGAVAHGHPSSHHGRVAIWSVRQF